eukprot:68257_1
MSDDTTSDLVEEIKRVVSDVELTIRGNKRIYAFKLNGTALKSFNKDGICLELECEGPPPKKTQSSPQPKKKEPPKKLVWDDDEDDDKKKDEEDDANYFVFEPKQQQQEEQSTQSKPDAEPETKPKAETESKESFGALAAAKPLEVKANAKNAFRPSPIETEAEPEEELKSKSKRKKTPRSGKSPRSPNKSPKSPGQMAPAVKMTASKATFNSLKVGREKRVHLANADTFNGCEYMPNYKGSERGCVLLKSNATLEECGVIRKSQIEKFNSIDVTGEALKKIRRMIVELSSSGEEFSVQFSVPQIELNTVEIQFNGCFCPEVEFSHEYDANNYIIVDIPAVDGNKYLINRAGLKKGYRVFKVQGSMVLNKPFDETQRMLDKAGRDARITYQVVFIEGRLDWYNFTNPYPKKKQQSKKPKLKNKKSKKRQKPSTPLTPYTPSASGKNPKYFLRDKKNVTAYFDLRVDGDKRGRIELILFMGTCPKTCSNFLKLCTGDNKKGLTYKGKKFYKMYVGMGFEIGDVENNDGTGTSSIYGGFFPDENFKVRHAQYCLSMKNLDEPNTNASQFYIITADDAEFLDGKNVVFGYIAHKQSQALVDDLEEEGCSLTGKPNCRVIISKCGKLKK